MSLYPLVVSSPDGDVFRGDVFMLTLRGAAGDLAILAGHIPFVTAVKAGACKIELEDGRELLAHTDGGILSVSTDSVTLLSGSFTFDKEEKEE